MNELISVRYRCSLCGEENETFIDLSAGRNQSYTEDCNVCCKPNLLHIAVSAHGEIEVRAEFDE